MVSRDDMVTVPTPSSSSQMEEPSAWDESRTYRGFLRNLAKFLGCYTRKRALCIRSLIQIFIQQALIWNLLCDKHQVPSTRKVTRSNEGGHVSCPPRCLC